MANLYSTEPKKKPNELVSWLIKNKFAKDEKSAMNFLFLMAMIAFLIVFWVFIYEDKSTYIDRNIIDKAGSPEEIVNT